MILKFTKHVSRLVTTGAANVKKKSSEGDTSLCKESLLPKSRSMLKSFNSLLIKFNVSTQETSCQNFFSSLLYVREFFFDYSLVQEFFSYANALAGYFFSKSPNPPPSEVKWLAPNEYRRAFMATNELRAVCCKNRLRVCKIEKSDFLKICQNKGFGELVLKI